MYKAGCGHEVESYRDSIYVRVWNSGTIDDLSTSCLTLCNSCYLDYMIEGKVVEKLSDDFE